MFEMRSLHADSSDEAIDTRSERRVPELQHRIRKIAFGVECSCSDVDVDHQLFVRRTDGAVEALPCLQSSAEREYLLREEEAVPAYSHNITRRVLRKNNVQSGEDRCYIQVPILRVASQKAG